ncbi:hypothetical protein GCM10027615_24150 [Plantactinospora veratri]
MQTAPLATILETVPARPELPAPELAETASPEWFALAAQRKAQQTRRYARLDADAAGSPDAAEQPDHAEQLDDPGAPAELPAAARHILTAVRQVRFVHLYATPPAGGPGDAPELVAVARGTVTGKDRWLGLSLIEVVPAARRRGLAQHMVRALAEWAAGLGASRAFLQVEERNEAAVSLYRRLGFTTHHTYQTRVAPH